MPAGGVGSSRASTKTFARFRMLERPGAMIGVYQLAKGPTVFPFQVDATKLTNLFTLERTDLKVCMASMHPDEVAKVQECVYKAHREHTEALKITMSQSFKNKVDAQGDGQMSEVEKAAAEEKRVEEHKALIEGIFQDTDRVQGQTVEIQDGLREMRDRTDVLTDLFLHLGGEQSILDAIHTETAAAEDRQLASREKQKNELMKKANERTKAEKYGKDKDGKPMGNAQRRGTTTGREADTQDLIAETNDPDAALTAAAVM